LSVGINVVVSFNFIFMLHEKRFLKQFLWCACYLTSLQGGWSRNKQSKFVFMQDRIITLRMLINPDKLCQAWRVCQWLTWMKITHTFTVKLRAMTGFRFSHQHCWGFKFTGVWCCVFGWVIPGVLLEHSALICYTIQLMHYSHFKTHSL
jgi:hypothetical protein